MTTLFALFSSLGEAGDALRMIADTELGDGKAYLLSEWPDMEDNCFVLQSVSNPVSEFVGQVGPRARPSPGSKGESSGGVASFFRRSLEKGGQVIAVSLGDESYEDRAVSMFEMMDAVAVAATES